MVKRLLSILLVTAMGITFLAACGQKTDETTGTSSAANTASTSTAAASSTVADNDVPKDVAKLTIVNFGDVTPRRTEFFAKDLHDKVMQDLNIDLTVSIFPWGSNQPQLMAASGQDFATFSDSLGGFSQAVSKGWWQEIPQADLDKYTADLQKVRAPYGYDDVMLNGKIYAVPMGNQPYAGGFQTLMIRQDLLDEVGVTDIKTVDDLTNAMQLVKAKHPDYTMVVETGETKEYLRGLLEPNQLVTFYDRGYSYVYVDSLTKDDKVYSWLESEEFKNVCQLNEKWKNLGFIDSKALSNQSQLLADWKAGKAFAYAGTPARPMEELPGILKSVPNAKLKLYRFGTQPFMYQSVENVAYGVSSGSKSLDRYLMFFNWMVKSQDNYDLLAYGVKDKDYTLQGDRVQRITADPFWDEWQISNTTYKRYDMTVSDDFIAAYKKNDEGAIKAKLTGFTLDESGLKAEEAKMQAIWAEKVAPLECGFVSYDKGFPEVLKSMKDAGLDKYMAEFQKQFSDWYAAQPK